MKTKTLDWGENMAKKEVKKQAVKGVYSIVHAAFITDRIGFSTTLVSGCKSKKEAFEFFNEEIADDRYKYKITSLKNVDKTEAYNKEK